jgi:hypothetical protein
MWDGVRMDKKISRLRRQIARAPRNSRGRRKYSESLRQELMELAGTVNLREIWAEKGDPHDGKWRFPVLFQVGPTPGRA